MSYTKQNRLDVERLRAAEVNEPDIRSKRCTSLPMGHVVVCNSCGQKIDFASSYERVNVRTNEGWITERYHVECFRQ